MLKRRTLLVVLCFALPLTIAGCVGKSESTFVPVDALAPPSEEAATTAAGQPGAADSPAAPLSASPASPAAADGSEG